jgi:DnaA family protein
MHQVPLALAPEPLSSFDAFVPGTNTATVALLRGCAPPTSPVYLWGPPGSGKTHLLHALAHECQKSGLCVGWIDAAGSMSQGFEPRWALLVLDDVHRLGADAQHAAFALLVEAQAHGVPWAAAGSVPPVDLQLRDDLRTRIGWGQTFALEALGEPETRAVLRREADRRGIFLSDDVMDYLLSRFERDLSFLMRLLDRLDGFAMSKSRAVTVPLLKLMLVEGAAATTMPP